MTTYVALLYSIVLDKSRRVAMADLRGIAKRLGYENPRTLVSTGNMIFEAGDRPVADIEAALEKAFEDFHGKHVDIIVRRAEDWQKLVAANPFADQSRETPDLVCVRVMRNPAGANLAALFDRYSTEGEQVAIVDGDVWVAFTGRPSESRLAAILTPQRMGGIGTSRNWNTIRRMGEML